MVLSASSMFPFHHPSSVQQQPSYPNPTHPLKAPDFHPGPNPAYPPAPPHFFHHPPAPTPSASFPHRPLAGVPASNHLTNLTQLHPPNHAAPKFDPYRPSEFPGSNPPVTLSGQEQAALAAFAGFNNYPSHHQTVQNPTSSASSILNSVHRSFPIPTSTNCQNSPPNPLFDLSSAFQSHNGGNYEGWKQESMGEFGSRVPAVSSPSPCAFPGGSEGEKRNSFQLPPSSTAYSPYLHSPNSHPAPTKSQQQFSWLRSVGRLCGAGTNNVRVRTRDKYRMVYSDYQRLELEKEFCSSKYINTSRKTELSQSLALTERQIKIWFQNRRAKERKQGRKVDSTSSSHTEPLSPQQSQSEDEPAGPKGSLGGSPMDAYPPALPSFCYPHKPDSSSAIL